MEALIFGDGLREPLLIHWLEYVVDAIDGEGTNGVLIVSGREDDC